MALPLRLLWTRHSIHPLLPLFPRSLNYPTLLPVQRGDLGGQMVSLLHTWRPLYAASFSMVPPCSIPLLSSVAAFYSVQPLLPHRLLVCSSVYLDHALVRHVCYKQLLCNLWSTPQSKDIAVNYQVIQRFSPALLPQTTSLPTPLLCFALLALPRRPSFLAQTITLTLRSLVCRFHPKSSRRVHGPFSLLSLMPHQLLE